MEVEVKAAQKKDEGAVPLYLTSTTNWTLDPVVDLLEEWAPFGPRDWRWCYGTCEEKPGESEKKG